jgi:hypothetical protein
MNPAVNDELVQRDPRHLAADGVEAADDHGFWSVVDDEVDTGRLLKSTYVAPFFADDASLQLISWQGQNRDRDFRGLVGCDALNGLGHDFSSPTLALVAGRQFRLTDLARDFVAQLLLDIRHQDSSSFLARHVGDALELLLLLADRIVELSPYVVERLLSGYELALAPVDVLGLAIEVLFLL